MSENYKLTIMKELSIEEKAKAYDIALAKIKMLLGTGSNCSREDLEYVFPELAESEDKKIMKALIYHFQGDGCICTNEYRIDYKDIRAWLEKQCEQKPAAWLQELEDKLANATPKQLAEWKEKYFKEEPAEWSDEDEMQARQIERIVHDDGCSRKLQEQIADWLKTLKDRVQRKQKWSEKDDRMYNMIVSFIPQHLTAVSYTACITWLKSLRPQSQWKPSDEQMRQLHKYCPDNMPLTELYEQLKKLREE